MDIGQKTAFGLGWINIQLWSAIRICIQYLPSQIRFQFLATRLQMQAIFKTKKSFFFQEKAYNCH
jgi:hypothetical protein